MTTDPEPRGAFGLDCAAQGLPEQPRDGAHHERSHHSAVGTTWAVTTLSGPYPSFHAFRADMYFRLLRAVGQD